MTRRSQTIVRRTSDQVLPERGMQELVALDSCRVSYRLRLVDKETPVVAYGYPV
jgi:hypothetical protein